MKTNLDKHFKTNEDLETNGVWYEIDDGVKFLVKPFKKGPKTKAALAKYYKPYARQIEMGTLNQDKIDEIEMKLFINVCLVDWSGVKDDGKDLAFTAENALELFQHLPDLFNTLWRHANDTSNYKEELGNS